MGKRLNSLDENYFTSEINEKHDVNFYLAENEKVLWKGRPKKSAFVLGKTLAMMPFALLWGAIDFGIIFGIIGTGGAQEMGPMVFVLIPFFALHLAPVWIWLGSMIKARREVKDLEYVITNKRVLVFKGRGNVYIKDAMDIAELNDAKLKINFIDKILRVGDITLYGADGKSVEITDIAKAPFLHQKFLGLCNVSSESDRQEFYDNKFECPYCETIFDASEKKCPSCGSSKRTMV